mmetsp:Transcript_8759/g.12543  ORF Transcript_8759/g.12543 Transcript_8759/m.12543 type:complete len:80 (-) Transcript_8759:854-1093(-)
MRTLMGNCSPTVLSGHYIVSLNLDSYFLNNDDFLFQYICNFIQSFHLVLADATHSLRTIGYFFTSRTSNKSRIFALPVS